MDQRMYILVNEDIKISKGKLAGQVGHAVSAFMYHTIVLPMSRGEQIDLPAFQDYMTEQKKIILKCPQEILEKLERAGGFTVIRDKGYTHLDPNTLTCVNFGVFEPHMVPEWIKELKLYN